jgi:hypothetical protein
MNSTIKLSVSSVLLAGLMTGCSQQQFQGGGQQLAGGSQVAGGQQILGGGGGQQILGGGQSAGGSQVAGGQQIMGGQQLVGGSQSAGGQQLAGGQQVLGGQQRSSAVDTQVQDTLVPITSHAHNAVAQSNEHAHNVQAKQRVYVPLPDAMKEKAPAVFMYEQPKAAEPVYYEDNAQPVYYEQNAQKPIARQKPVVRHQGIGMPPAQPGQCFAKVNTPAKFKNNVKRVQVSPAVNKRVKVRGPQYTWINKKVLARPATHRNEYIPAVYRNITKKVLVKPAHYAWQKGKTGPVTRIDNMTGEILCRVKIPAVYRTVTQKVVARPAQRVKRYVPAVYRTIKQKKLASPAVFRTIKTPARFVNKNYRVQISGAKQEWKPIVCKAPNAQGRAAVQRPQPVVSKRVSNEQRQLAAQYKNQQQQLHRQWLQQEAARKRAGNNSGAQQHQNRSHNANAQLKANQQRRAQHAAKERQRLANLAQKRKVAQQARLRQVQIAKQKRMAQHQANLLAQRKSAQMRTQNAPKPSYAKPKARPYQQQRVAAKTNYQANVKQVMHTPKPRVQPKAPVAAKQSAGAGNDNTPLTRANAVFRIQKALLQRGFNPGPVDGKLGPTTVKALTAFQETKGLKTGTLNRDTLSALNLVN